jgi:hypothetical protein
MKHRFSLLVLALGVLVFGLQNARGQDAHGNHDAYMFIVGGPPVEGPDVATAPDGSTITLSGAGSFNAGPDKTASGGGTFTITDSGGAAVAAGAWQRCTFRTGSAKRRAWIHGSTYD